MSTDSGPATAEQLSLDESLAPNLPVWIPKVVDPSWKAIRTPAEGVAWHRIRRARGGTAVVTMCNLGGHKVSKTGAPFVPCPRCLAAK